MGFRTYFMYSLKLLKNIYNKILSHKKLSWYLLSSFFTALFNIAVNPFLSIGLSHNDFAIIGYYTSFVSLFLPLIAFTLNNFYSRKYYLLNEKEREDTYQTILSIFFVLGFVSFSFLVIIYYFYHLYFVKSIDFFPYAILSFLPLYFNNFYNLYLLDLRMKNKAKKYFFVTVLVTILSGLLSILLVYIIRYGAIGRLIALLISSIISFIYVLLIKKYKFFYDIKIFKEAFGFCWPLIISAVFYFFFLGIDRVFLEKINDNYNLGLYNIGMQVATYYTIFSTAVFQTFNPNIYKYGANKEIKNLFKLFLFILLIIILPLFVFIFVSDYFIAFITYNKYTEATIYANIIVFKAVTTTFAFYISDSMIALGYTKLELLTKIMSSIIVIIMYYYLIEKYHFIGAAIGQVLSWLIMGLVSLMFIFGYSKKARL